MLPDGRYVIIEERTSPGHSFAIVLKSVALGVETTFDTGLEAGFLNTAVQQAAHFVTAWGANVLGDFQSTTPGP